MRSIDAIQYEARRMTVQRSECPGSVYLKRIEVGNFGKLLVPMDEPLQDDLRVSYGHPCPDMIQRAHQQRCRSNVATTTKSLLTPARA